MQIVIANCDGYTLNLSPDIYNFAFRKREIKKKSSASWNALFIGVMQQHCVCYFLLTVYDMV